VLESARGPDIDFETVVSGHMALFGTPEDVQTNREYIHDLRASAAGALRIVGLREVAAAIGMASARWPRTLAGGRCAPATGLAAEHRPGRRTAHAVPSSD
jgi:hypothetical protein